jgi:hypothetical protein
MQDIFLMKTINITYSYGSIFVTHIIWLWGLLKFFILLFVFSDGHLWLAHHTETFKVWTTPK